MTSLLAALTAASMAAPSVTASPVNVPPVDAPTLQFGFGLGTAQFNHFTTAAPEAVFDGDIFATATTKPTAFGVLADTDASDGRCAVGRLVYYPKTGGQEVQEFKPNCGGLPATIYLKAATQNGSAYDRVCSQVTTGVTTKESCFQFPDTDRVEPGQGGLPLPTFGFSAAGWGLVHANPTPAGVSMDGGQWQTGAGGKPWVLGWLADTAAKDGSCANGTVTWYPKTGGEEVHRVDPQCGSATIYSVSADRPRSAYDKVCWTAWSDGREAGGQQACFRLT